MDKEEFYNKVSLDIRTGILWRTEEVAHPNWEKQPEVLRVYLGMGLSLCPSRASSQNSSLLWWLTCSVSASTTLDITQKPPYPPFCLSFLPCSQNFYLLKTMIYSGNLKDQTVSWQPLYVSANWPFPHISVLFSPWGWPPGTQVPTSAPNSHEEGKGQITAACNQWLLNWAVFLIRKLGVKASHLTNQYRPESIYQTLCCLQHWCPMSY